MSNSAIDDATMSALSTRLFASARLAQSRQRNTDLSDEGQTTRVNRVGRASTTNTLAAVPNNNSNRVITSSINVFRFPSRRPPVDPDGNAPDSTDTSARRDRVREYMDRINRVNVPRSEPTERIEVLNSSEENARRLRREFFRAQIEHIERIRPEYLEATVTGSRTARLDGNGEVDQESERPVRRL